MIEPHTYLANASAKKQNNITELLQLEIKLKNGRYKGVENNNDSDVSSACSLLILHGSSGTSGEQRGNEVLGRVDSVDGVLGVCSPYGLAMYRKTVKEINGLHLPLGFKFDSAGV